MAPAVVTHQVVPGLLPRAVEVDQGDAQCGGAQDAVGAAGKAFPVERPVQRAGVDPQFGADGAGGRKAGADGARRVLGKDGRHLWSGGQAEKRGDIYDPQ